MCAACGPKMEVSLARSMQKTFLSCSSTVQGLLCTRLYICTIKIRMRVALRQPADNVCLELDKSSHILMMAANLLAQPLSLQPGRRLPHGKSGPGHLQSTVIMQVFLFSFLVLSGCRARSGKEIGRQRAVANWKRARNAATKKVTIEMLGAQRR